MKTAAKTKSKKTKAKPSKATSTSSARTRTPAPEPAPLVFDRPTIAKEDCDMEVAVIVPSPDNRDLTTADVEGDLVESIRQWGVLTRPWVYPLADGDLRRKKGATHELIAGERRWLGAQVVGLQTIPVTVFHCTEKQADELRIIENLQRRDLSALQEARSFARLVEKHGYQVHNPDNPELSLTHRLDKSESYIYGRIKLAQLPQLATQALEDGKLSASVAIRIARIPGTKLQVQCTKEVLEGVGWQPGPMTDKQAAAHISERYMTQLKGAPFDIKDPELLPIEHKDGARIAGGACTDCPFRSGNQSEMFDSDKGKSRGDVCTNPDCYGRKKDAAWDKAQEQARAAGKIVVPEDEAENVFSQWGATDQLSSNCRYVFPKDKCPEDPEGRTYQELISGGAGSPLEVVPHVVRSSRSGRVHELLLRADAKRAISARGIEIFEEKAKEKKTLDIEQLIRQREMAIRNEDREWRLARVVRAIAEHYEEQPLADRYIAQAFAGALFGYDDRPKQRIEATLKTWIPVRAGLSAELLLPQFLAVTEEHTRYAVLVELALRQLHAAIGSSGQQEEAVAALAAELGLNLERLLENRNGDAEARRQCNDFVSIPEDFDTLKLIAEARCPERVKEKRPVLSFDWHGRKWINMSVGHGTKDCWELVPVSAYGRPTHRYGEFDDYGNEGLIVTQKGIEYALCGPRRNFVQRSGQCRRCGCTELQQQNGQLREPGDTVTWTDGDRVLCSSCGPKI